MKIATWNLGRPWKNGGRSRADLQRRQIRGIGTDICVLTETWSEIQLPSYLGAVVGAEHQLTTNPVGE